MNGGFFITLYDEETLKLYLNRGIYGFLMKPVGGKDISPKSVHYKVLADYACGREGCDVFFFLKRKIYYGGKLKGHRDIASFFLNGTNTPLCRDANASLFWDETKRYIKTNEEGIFKIGKVKDRSGNNPIKCQPYILRFSRNENTGKYILSDDLYFKLSDIPYPLPSNSIRNMSFCTLTPHEVSLLKKLIYRKNSKIDYKKCANIDIGGNVTCFEYAYVDLDNDFINEAELEFTILSSLKPFKSLFSCNYVICRQVPLSPFKPANMDKADICLYDVDNAIQNGAIPNIVIELKREKANKDAYNQVVRYLSWLEKITKKSEFNKIKAFIISKSFVKIKKTDVDIKYNNKIIMYSLDNKKRVNLV